MGYVANNLMPDEQVLHMGHVHFFSLIPSLLMLGLGAGLVYLPMQYNVAPAFRNFVYLAGGLFVLSGAIYFVNALVRKLTTELALTTRRVIAKSGLIVREISEMNYGRIESFSVDQSILGMLFGYGTFFIHGVGGSRAGVKCIARPMEFRRYALEALDQVSRGEQVKISAEAPVNKNAAL